MLCHPQHPTSHILSFLESVTLPPKTYPSFSILLESYQSSSPISSPTRSPSPFPLFTSNHSPLQNLSQHAAAHDGAVGPRLTLGRSARRRATTRQAQSRAPATTTTCQPALPCPTIPVHRFLGSGTGFPTTGCTSCVCALLEESEQSGLEQVVRTGEENTVGGRGRPAFLRPTTVERHPRAVRG